MGRTLTIAIILIIAVSFNQCGEVLVDNEIFRYQDGAEDMVVDFEIEVLDSTRGIIQLVDLSSGVDRIEWIGQHETGIWDYDFNIIDALPGDTIIVQLKGLGVNVITLTAWKDVFDEDTGLIIDILKSRSKEVEFRNILKVRPFLKYVDFVDYPNLDKNGLEWDPDNTPPDVYIEMIIWEPEFAKTFLNESLMVDLEKASLPVRFVSDSTVSLFEVEMDFIIKDFDPLVENQFGYETIERIGFNGRWLDYPKEPSFSEYDLGDIKIGIEWIEN